MRAERKRRRKLARQARVLNVGRYVPYACVHAFAAMLPVLGVFCSVTCPSLAELTCKAGECLLSFLVCMMAVTVDSRTDVARPECVDVAIWAFSGMR